jgi:heptosyltransferase-2
MWEPGVPAMQAPRSVSQTKAMPSQAIQLPQGFGVAVERVVDQ